MCVGRVVVVVVVVNVVVVVVVVVLHVNHDSFCSIHKMTWWTFPDADRS